MTRPFAWSGGRTYCGRSDRGPDDSRQPLVSSAGSELQPTPGISLAEGRVQHDGAAAPSPPSLVTGAPVLFKVAFQKGWPSTRVPTVFTSGQVFARSHEKILERIGNRPLEAVCAAPEDCRPVRLTV